MTIKEARIAAGLSRAEMSRRFEIPIRTLEDWDAGKANPPVWAEKLILAELNRIKEAK
jgi:DNA-binding transcriptional regulator YiaG